MFPETAGALAASIRVAAERGQPVTAVGSGHSWSGLAATAGMAVHTRRLCRLLDVDPDRREVSVEAGITLRRLARKLAGFGLALDHPGELGDQTVGGALATALHGSSARRAGLGAAVTALEVMGADGELRPCSRDADAELFDAARVGLGAVGIVVRVTLAAVPAGALRVQEAPCSRAELVATFDEEASRHDRFQAWWSPRWGARTQAVDRADDQPGGRNALAATRDRWRGAETPAWGRRAFVVRTDDALVHTPRRRTLETEWALPRHELLAAFGELAAGRAGPAPPGTLPVRLRVAPPGDAWLSPAEGRETGYLSCRVAGGRAGRGWLAAVSAVLAAHGGRPQWSTLHPLERDALAPRYPHWDRFMAVRRRIDPAGLFANPELDRVLGPPEG